MISQKDQETEDLTSILSFTVGEEVFAAGIDNVLGIMELSRITKVPRCPEYMLGVVNLRGSILPVIDSRRRFGIEPGAFTRNTCIIILELGFNKEKLKTGLLVDAVKEVIEINLLQLQSPPSMGSRFKVEFMQGIYHHREQFIMLLDLDKLFSGEELLVVQELSTSLPQENKEL